MLMFFTQVFRILFELLALVRFQERPEIEYWESRLFILWPINFSPTHVPGLFDLPNKPLLQPFPQWLVVKPQVPVRQCQTSKEYE